MVLQGVAGVLEEGSILLLAFPEGIGGFLARHGAHTCGEVRHLPISVLARRFAVEGWPGKSSVLQTLWHLSDQLTPVARVAAYNQAMMDLGATLCTRSQPACASCPLQAMCQGFQHGSQLDYPQPRPSKARPSRHTWMLLHHDGEQLLLQRRPPQGIWGGLWSLPEITSLQQLADWQQQQFGRSEPCRRILEHELKHVFTHFELSISLAEVMVDAELIRASRERVADSDGLQWIARENLQQLGMPVAVTRLLDRCTGLLPAK